VLIFIDFDGVLHPLQRSEAEFVRLPLLWKILRAAPHVEAVFSSSWREIYRPDELVEFVTSGGGEDLAHRFIGQTPRTPRARSTYVPGHNSERHNECLRWLAENGRQHRAWLAIDDVPQVFPPNSPNLYLVNGKTGLTNEDVAAIIERINLAAAGEKIK